MKKVSHLKMKETGVGFPGGVGNGGKVINGKST